MEGSGESSKSIKGMLVDAPSGAFGGTLDSSSSWGWESSFPPSLTKTRDLWSQDSLSKSDCSIVFWSGLDGLSGVVSNHLTGSWPSKIQRHSY